MFGFIKKLIAGIIGFITGLLPGKGKKSGGYYLELKEEEPTTKPAPTASNGAKPAPVAAAPVAAKSKPAPEPKKAAKAEPKPAPKPVPAETSFASKYLIPSAASNGRRRPGANMNGFLDMAKEVKIAPKEVKTSG
ncbi:MAG TPA: hypothetical protein VK203_14495 [Nostocaceae cyanobacterium]|nr:hypothetical protein [Nostocaceae cyanobacterium]